MYNEYKAISYNENRIKIKFDGKNPLYYKNTNIEEYINYLRMKQVINMQKMFIPQLGVYRIKTVNVISYKNGMLITEKIKGNNLECLFRNGGNYKIYVNILNRLLNVLVDNKIYWKDMAPRNIFVNFEEEEIWLLDFEKGFSSCFENYMWEIKEEYRAFVISRYSILSLDHDYALQACYPIFIKSKRVAAILKEKGLDASEKNMFQEYLNLIHLEEAFERNKQIIFPIIQLEDILSKKGYKEYAIYVCQLKKTLGMLNAY